MKNNDQWIQPITQHESADIELICFPFAGGGTMTYQPWGKLLCPKINLNAVLLPGREIRIKQAPQTNIDIVCREIMQEFFEKYKDKTCVFFGHSMGTSLAYEVAKRLEQTHNYVLRALVISGRQVPHLRFGGSFHQQSDDVLIQEIKRFGQTPDVIFEDQEMRNLLLSILRADYTLLETYRLDDPTQLNCPILTCTGEDDTEVTPKQIQLWQELSTKKSQHNIFDGGHFYLLDPINRQQLVNTINNFVLV